MKRKTRGIPENREVHPGTGYIQRTLQATLTIWFILTVVIIAAFGLSETLRVAGITRDTNLLITFIFSLVLNLIALWLVPKALLTLKGEESDYDKSSA